MPANLNTIFFKYKVLHIIMWLLVGSSTFFTYYEASQPLFPQIANAAMVIIVSTIPFYTTAYVLIPQTLYKKFYFRFIVLLVLLVFLSGLLMMVAVRSVDHIFAPERPIIPTDYTQLRFAINIFTWTSLIAAFGAGGLKIMSDSFRLRKRLLEVEKEKISTELNFLRSQVNPHFLFNVMNTIYFQIDKKNTVARASVEKLSEMLRYQLYECTTDRISIAKELDYIRNYVAIQTLRMEKESDIQLQVKGEISGFTIAPLLILPIVENAFKHGINAQFGNAWVHIKLKLDTNAPAFLFSIENNKPKLPEPKKQMNGGIGIENAKKRLHMIYPKTHQLRIEETNNTFIVELSIDKL